MNEAQDSYRFSVLERSKSLELVFAVRTDTNITNFLPGFVERHTAWRGYHPFIVCLFDTAINDNSVRNLFSVDIAGVGFAALTTHNVANTFIPSDRMSSYLIFQLVFFALKFSGCNLPFHSQDRGCLFDYREEKIRILDAIRMGHICDDCKTELEKSGSSVSSEQLGAIFSLLEIASKALQTPPMTESDRKAKSFIGSSTEGLGIARAIQTELEHDYDVEIWTQSEVFGLGRSTLESLEDAVCNYDFGVFVFTPDDAITMRGKDSSVARDNVIFEAGLFIGKLGRDRAFIVRPRGADMQIPSDLNGITVADYAIARVPDIGSSTILRYLDRGIMGILGPHIATEADARQLVRVCYFGPLGERSFGANRGTDYNAGIADKAAYYREANEQMLVCALLEDVAVLDNLDTILSVAGIDLYSIGPNDFAQSLSYPGQPDHPEVVKTMQEITRRIRQAGRTMQSDVMQGAWVSDMLLDAGCRILSS
jgi:4-hydroxy-2-oxoheptanedioate aldolase